MDIAAVHESHHGSCTEQRTGTSHVLDDSVALPAHPLSIKPYGNAYTAPQNSIAATGNFHCLPSEVLVSLLECLDAFSLVQLGACCKYLYAYTSSAELWKNLFIT